jgi:hypothetical protein
MDDVSSVDSSTEISAILGDDNKIVEGLSQLTQVIEEGECRDRFQKILEELSDFVDTPAILDRRASLIEEVFFSLNYWRVEGRDEPVKNDDFIACLKCIHQENYLSVLINHVRGQAFQNEYLGAAEMSFKAYTQIEAVICRIQSWIHSVQYHSPKRACSLGKVVFHRRCQQLLVISIRRILLSVLSCLREFLIPFHCATLQDKGGNPVQLLKTEKAILKSQLAQKTRLATTKRSSARSSYDKVEQTLDPVLEFLEAWKSEECRDHIDEEIEAVFQFDSQKLKGAFLDCLILRSHLKNGDQQKLFSKKNKKKEWPAILLGARRYLECEHARFIACQIHGRKVPDPELKSMMKTDPELYGMAPEQGYRKSAIFSGPSKDVCGLSLRKVTTGALTTIPLIPSSLAAATCHPIKLL